MATAPISKEVFNISRSALDAAATTLAAIDRGCSLTKAVYVSKSGEGDTATHYALHCVVFSNTEFEGCLHFLKENALLPSSGSIRVTGTGCDMHKDTVEKILGLKVEFIDEIVTMYRGVHFFLSNIEDEESAFYPSIERDASMQIEMAKNKAAVMKEMVEKFKSESISDPNAQFPCLLVILGSASMSLAIQADGKSRMTGISLIGGKTLLGMGRALAGATSYDELIELANNGNSGNVDTIVEEVLVEDPNSSYGRFPPKMSLFPFGKLADHDKDISEYRREDRAAAVVNVITSSNLNLIVTTMVLAKAHRVVVGGHGARAELIRSMMSRKFHASPLVTGELKFLKTGNTCAVGALIAKPEDIEKLVMV